MKFGRLEDTKNFDKKPSFSSYKWWIIAGILILTVSLYWSSLNGSFLNYDDPGNVVNNIHIQYLNFKTVSHFFSTSILYMYAPLSFISYAIDFKMDGLNPFYFRLTNLIIHLLNIVLVYIFAGKLFKRPEISILTALLFAVHPINVDTVAWISTRSNLLSALFFLGTLILYLLFLEKKHYLYYILSVLSFALSLFSKSAVVMLPFVLFGIDYFFKRNIDLKLFIEKIPYFILSIVIGIIAVYYRTDTETTQTLVHYNLFERFLIICYSSITYLYRAFLPFNLSEIYAYPPKINGFLPLWYYISPFLVVLFVGLLYKLRQLKREIVFGVFFFLITIIITQIPLLEDGFTANRYTYLPYIGILIAIAVVSDYFSVRFKKVRMILISVFLLMIFAFSLTTHQRSLVWMNTFTLFDHAIKQSPDASFAYNSRGIARYAGNDKAGALGDYTMAIKLNPEYSGAYYNRGIIYYEMMDYEKALNDYSKAIELNSNFASAYCARGILKSDILKNDSLAIIDYNRAIQINHSFVQAYYNRGISKLRMNEITNACTDFNTVKNLGYIQADEPIQKYCR